MGFEIILIRVEDGLFSNFKLFKWEVVNELILNRDYLTAKADEIKVFRQTAQGKLKS